MSPRLCSTRWIFCTSLQILHQFNETAKKKIFLSLRASCGLLQQAGAVKILHLHVYFHNL